MSTRLQVLVDEAELAELQRVAKRHRLTLSAWVRQVLREAVRREPADDSRRKLAVVREAATHRYPAPGIKQMLGEIERGYTGGPGGDPA